MEQSLETVYQPPDPPLKKAKLEVCWKDRAEEEKWFTHMRNVRQWQAAQALYDNAMNSLIDEGPTSLADEASLEDEAVTMAIRSHGLTRGTQNFASHRVTLDLNRSHIENLLQSPSTSRSFFDSASRDDILSQAVTVAIRKKGLGALER